MRSPFLNASHARQASGVGDKLPSFSPPQQHATRDPRAAQLLAQQAVAAASPRQKQLQSAKDMMASAHQPVAQLARLVFRPYKADTREPGEITENNAINADGNTLGEGQRADYPNLPTADLEALHLVGHGNQGGVQYDGDTVWAKTLAADVAEMPWDNLKQIRRVQFHSCMAADTSFDGELKKKIVAREGEGSVIERFSAELRAKMITKRDAQKKIIGKNRKYNLAVRGPYSRSFSGTDNTSRVLKGWGKGSQPTVKWLKANYGQYVTDLGKAEEFYAANINGQNAHKALATRNNYLETEEDSHGSVSFAMESNRDTSTRGWNT